MKRVLVTSALLYANGSIHFGHVAGAYLPADCYARFERLKGSDVLFISGSDEYGVAITLSAELAGRTPQEQVDHFDALNRKLFEKFNIQFDHFSRTTCQEHAPLVREFFNDLNENGYIEVRETEQLFSEEDERFLADRYVVGTCPKCGFEEARGDECGKCGANYEALDLKAPRSKLTGAPLTLKKTRHWFLLFDKFQKELEKFLSTRAWRPNVMAFAKRYVEEIRARAITRDLEWGVPLGLQEGKVFYVWFDAPIGYISATQDWAKRNQKEWEPYWTDSHYVQFIGKDNIPFHAVFFPAMIMGQNRPYKLVDDLVANEFLNLEGRQFSKSEGWFIELDHFFERFHTDQIRYTLAANAPESADSEFTWKDFQMRANQELLGKFGNLVNRVLVFVQNKCEGKVPASHPLEEIDLRFQNAMVRLVSEIHDAYANYRLRKVTTLLMELAQEGNTYFDVKTPWKDPQKETTLALCLECIKLLALVTFPLMPTTAQRIWHMLGFSDPLPSWQEVIGQELIPGTPLPKPSILFQKVEDHMIEEEIQKLQELHGTAVKEPPYDPLKEVISIEEFDKIDLRIGKILSAEKVEKSKKLLKLKVDIGFETRTVVSGISHHYSPQELIGKKIVLVANLRPAKLMGIESQGMVLAANLDKALELVTLQELPAGAKIS